MKKKISAGIGSFGHGPAPLNRKQQDEIAALHRMIDDQIELSESESGAPPNGPQGKTGHDYRALKPKKESISLRLDSDVLEWFRQSGEGYQTRMNSALRGHMESNRR